MTASKRELIALLRQEIAKSRQRRGGAVFFETSLCLHQGTQHPVQPCKECLLMQFVPAACRQRPVPCFDIPLDEAGRTLDSLLRQGSRRECEQAVLEWMEQTLARLEQELRDDAAKQ